MTAPWETIRGTSHVVTREDAAPGGEYPLAPVGARVVRLTAYAGRNRVGFAFIISPDMEAHDPHAFTRAMDKAVVRLGQAAAIK